MRELASISMTSPHELQSDHVTTRKNEGCDDAYMVTKLTQRLRRVSHEQELLSVLTADPLLCVLFRQAGWSHDRMHPERRRPGFWKQPAVCVKPVTTLSLKPYYSTSYVNKITNTATFIPACLHGLSLTNMWPTSLTTSTYSILSSIAHSLSNNSIPTWAIPTSLPRFFWSVPSPLDASIQRPV